MKILVTRPMYAAKSLCDDIEQLGCEPECLPLIEIIPTPHQDALKQAVKSLNDTDIALFISQPAVQYSLPLIKKTYPVLPSNLLFCALGPGTAHSLTENGIRNVIIPIHLPYESESLLKLDILQTQNIGGKKILIFRGQGGRELLADTLSERKALVQTIEAYQRQLPQIDIVSQLNKWKNSPPNCVITSSREGLLNLDSLLGNQNDWFKEIPIVVIGLRMFKLAHMLSFRNPILVHGADNISICTAIRKLKENNRQ